VGTYEQKIFKRTKVRDCVIDDAVNGQRAQCVANYTVKRYNIMSRDCIVRHVVNFNVPERISVNDPEKRMYSRDPRLKVFIGRYKYF